MLFYLPLRMLSLEWRMERDFTRIDIMTPEQIKALHPESAMQVCELEWLQARARGMRIIVEIGSYLGCSTRALATNPDSLVLAVDDWYGPRDAGLGPLEHMHVWQGWARVGSLPNVLSLRMDHSLLTPMRLHANMVFIDGAHDYESVERDIDSALSVSNAHALICGHDFGGQVAEVVHKWFPKFQQGPGSLWFATK